MSLVFMGCVTLTLNQMKDYIGLPVISGGYGSKKVLKLYIARFWASLPFLGIYLTSVPFLISLGLIKTVKIFYLTSLESLCKSVMLGNTVVWRSLVDRWILIGANAGEKVFIPRLSLTSSDTRLPFTFQRREFPLMVFYAMTINKSQGQSLMFVFTCQNQFLLMVSFM